MFLILAHTGEPLAPHDLWAAWNGDVLLLLGLALVLWLYVTGVRKVWARAGVGRGISTRRAAAFAGGFAALVIALISPLDALSGVLFSAHMVQHLILMLIAAPLLAWSDFPLALMYALPRRWSQRIGRTWNAASFVQRLWGVLRKPIAAWVLFGVTMWVWHVPTLYDAALRSEPIHALEHFSFLLTAMLFWWVLLDSSRLAHVRYGIAVPYLFTTGLHSGILGALLTFASAPWYSVYAAADAVRSWGVSPIQDQQIAGLIMWIPGGAVFTLLAIITFGVWLAALDKRDGHQAEQFTG
jgi:putative membrane protein